MKPHLSIVSPVYGCARLLPELLVQVKRYAAEITDDFEIVLVDDGSPDDAWKVIEQECAADPRVKGVALSRNFGQHYALTAGLEASGGDYVIVLDCDLQDDPRYIPDLYAMVAAGNDVVYTRKRERRHGGLRNVFGRVFHKILNLLLSDPRSRTEANIGNYSALSRRVVDAFVGMKDYHRHYLGLLRWMGFDTVYMDIDHHERPEGKSAYSLRRLAREAVVGVTSQSERLLHMSIAAGFFFVGTAMIGVVVLVALFFTVGFLEGWTSLMVVSLLSTGFVLTSLGIAGIYIGKMFEQTKGRPLYLVKDRRNFPDDDTAPSAPTR